MKASNSANGHSHSSPFPTTTKNGKQGRVVVVTGGAGFVGTNVAKRFLSTGQRVLILDNLSRAGVEKNLQWLQSTYGDLVEIEVADIRNEKAVQKVVRNASQVFHFAAQVAVTTSLDNPIDDFEINARGTLNLLEAIRHSGRRIPLLYTSSNKVYGDLADVAIGDGARRYEPEDLDLRGHGFSEARPLDFHSPYGCSKGAAGQYVLDYARTFKMPAVVFHMSCIYGLHQYGNEDQGWVAHFLIRALENEPITIYGDGKQVRDVLFVEDLVNAMLAAQQSIDRLSGQAFNIGGGPRNTISLLELLDCIEELNGKRPEVRFDSWRSADQLYYVSDIRKFSSATGWNPSISVRDGVSRLHRWLIETEKIESPRISTDLSFNRANSDRNGSSPTSIDGAPRSKRLWQKNGTNERKTKSIMSR